MQTGSSTIIKDAVTRHFLAYKALGGKAVQQLTDQQIHWRHSEGDNSIYIIVKHLHGNMRSRFTDFLNSDGEKPWRVRDDEFTADNASKENMMRLWEEGWACVLNAVAPLDDDDMQKTVAIRGEKHTVADALLRQIAHYAYHVGQIVYMAKTIKENDWQTLSIPRGGSPDYNDAMQQKHRHEK